MICTFHCQSHIERSVSLMEAIITSHADLKEQYSVALRLLSDARYLHGVTSPEAVAATKVVEELEGQLAHHPPARIGLKP